MISWPRLAYLSNLDMHISNFYHRLHQVSAHIFTASFYVCSNLSFTIPWLDGSMSFSLSEDEKKNLNEEGRHLAGRIAKSYEHAISNKPKT